MDEPRRRRRSTNKPHSRQIGSSGTRGKGTRVRRDALTKHQIVSWVEEREEAIGTNKGAHREAAKRFGVSEMLFLSR